jgi:bile acid:Na+ symporter, BASS family
LTEGIRIHFDQGSQGLLQLVLAFVMFGVALDLTPSDLRNAFRNPRPVMAGMVAQFLLLPALTFLLILVWQPSPGIALGLLLVAACPGGNVSNFISAIAKADIALSVSLTAISSLACAVVTPLNFGLWAGLLPSSQGLLRSLHIDPVQLTISVAMILALPVLAGATMNRFFPKVTARLRIPIRWVSMVIFLFFVAGAVYANRDGFGQYLGLVFALVLVHNLLALSTGYAVGRLARLNDAQCRSLSIETGIQNAGLGLVLSLTFFPGIPEMALVCAWWGVWHIVSGMSLAAIWSRFGRGNG